MCRRHQPLRRHQAQTPSISWSLAAFKGVKGVSDEEEEEEERRDEEVAGTVQV